MKFRIRFSLRTLLLTTLFAGSVMLCWRVREPWELSNLIQPPKEALRFDGMQDKDTASWSTISWWHIAYSMKDDHLILTSNTYRPESYVSDFIGVITAESGKVVIPPPNGKRVFQKKGKDWLLQKTRSSSSGRNYEYHVLDLSSGRDICQIPAAGNDVANFDETGEHLIVHVNDMLECYETKHWSKILTIPLPPGTTVYQFIDNFKTLITGQPINPDGSVSFGLIVVITAINCADQKTIWQWQSDLMTNSVGLSLDVDESKKHVNFGVSPAVVFCMGGQHTRSLDYSNPTSLKLVPYESRENDDELRNRYGWGPFIAEALSPNNEWQLVCLNDSNRIVLNNVTSKQKNVSSVNTQHYKPHCAAMSHDSRKIAAVVDNNAIAIWTSRREHFAWWGIYEQPEFWVAVLFFGALFWSIRRDWAERNEVAQNGEGQGAKQAA